MSSQVENEAPKITLSLPAWVPPTVAAAAKDLHAIASKDGNIQEIALIQRLISSQDMKYAWQELQSKNRTTGDFDYRLRLVDEDPRWLSRSSDEQEQLRDQALRQVFLSAVGIGKLVLADDDSSERRISSVRSLRSHFEQVITDLGATFSNRPMPAEYSRLRKSGLDVIAKLERLAAETPPYKRDAMDAIAAILILSQKLNSLFVSASGDGDASAKGSITRPRPTLSGLIARIASAILQRPISRDQIRDWKEGFWGGGIVG